jgi:hypothetical protein
METDGASGIEVQSTSTVDGTELTLPRRRLPMPDAPLRSS